MRGLKPFPLLISAVSSVTGCACQVSSRVLIGDSRVGQVRRQHWTRKGVISAVLIFALAAFANPCAAQLFGSPDELILRLRTADVAEQARLARALHLHSYKRDAGFGECGIRLLKAQLKPQTNTSLIQVKCGDEVDLVALEQSDNGWSWVDSVPLSDAYDKLRVDVTSLLGPPVQQVIVHNHCTAHGSGIYYAHFLVLALVSGRLEVIFSALERGVEAPYDGAVREESSAFTLSPSTGDTRAIITDTTTYHVGKRSFSVQRSFVWDDGLRAFVAEAVDSVRFGKADRK